MKEPIGKIVKALGGSPWFQGYVRGKLGHDPVFEEARQAVAQVGGPVIDLGCGAGIFGLWLGVHGFDGSYRGYDLGRWKIEAGLEAAQSLRLQSYGLEVADMTRSPSNRRLLFVLLMSCITWMRSGSESFLKV